MNLSRWFVVVSLIVASFGSLRAGVMQYEVAGPSSIRDFNLEEHFRPSSIYHYLDSKTLLDSNGQKVPIPQTRFSSENYPTAWNQAGEIVGKSYFGGNEQVGFIYKNGEITYFEPKQGIIAQGANAINNVGQVVGGGWPLGSQLAYLYSNGVKTNLGGLPGGGTSIANDINDAGVVVGQSLFCGDRFYKAKGYVVKDGVMSDLNDVTSGLDGLNVNNTLAITSDGWIYATVAKSSPGTTDERYRENLWLKPVVNEAVVTSTDSSSSTTPATTVIDTTSGGFWTTPTDTQSLNVPAISSGRSNVFTPQPAPVPEPATYLIWGSLALCLIWKRLA